MTKTTLTGGCLCGRVRYALAERPPGVVECHCGMCRRWHGHVGGYATVPYAAMTLTSGESDVSWYRSSDFADRGFCRHCSSSLFWRHDNRRNADIAAGTLDQPTGLKTLFHIFVEDKADYTALTDGLPQHAKSSAS